MGGNIDRVYAVNPQHMRVNYPRHISKSTDVDVPSFEDWPEEIISHMNGRIRVAEILRETVDALPLGSGDVETLSYSKVAALDKRFEQLLTEFPLFDVINLPIDATLKKIAIQRATGWLSIQARRARFLRPFIQIKGMPKKFDVFRRQCLDAAQKVMETASSILSQTVDTTGSPRAASETQDHRRSRTGPNSRRAPYFGGLVINHVR